MGVSADGFPIIGQVPNEDELYIAASFQDLGIVLCFYSAKALVQMMNKIEEKELNWFPMACCTNEGRMSRKSIDRLLTIGPQSNLESKTLSRMLPDIFCQRSYRRPLNPGLYSYSTSFAPGFPSCSNSLHLPALRYLVGSITVKAASDLGSGSIPLTFDTSIMATEKSSESNWKDD